MDFEWYYFYCSLYSFHFHLICSNVSLSGVNVDGQSTKEESSSSFSGVWSSGNIQKTKNNARTVIPLKIQFENGSSVQMSLQCKFYPLNENAHNVWGTPLKNIEVKCSHKKELNSTTVDEINFR